MGSLCFYRDPIRSLRDLGMTEGVSATKPWDDGGGVSTMPEISYRDRLDGNGAEDAPPYWQVQMNRAERSFPLRSS